MIIEMRTHRTKPGSFFFMRGVPDLLSREPLKARFYEGELWKKELEHVLTPMLQKYEVVLATTLKASFIGEPYGQQRVIWPQHPDESSCLRHRHTGVLLAAGQGHARSGCPHSVGHSAHLFAFSGSVFSFLESYPLRFLGHSLFRRRTVILLRPSLPTSRFWHLRRASPGPSLLCGCSTCGARS